MQEAVKNSLFVAALEFLARYFFDGGFACQYLEKDVTPGCEGERISKL
ncbi:MAG: hypothetical protein NTW99_01540 [Chloroflexi bacterium]|nr:hypothetical protein [Chloroflexota bacterium]